MLQMDDILTKVGIRDGDELTLVHLRRPVFDLVTANAEAVDDGESVKVRESQRWGWGWAAGFVPANFDTLSVRLGPTAVAETNVTDYFIGALPEDNFEESTSQNFLGDKGIGLVLSTHSNWSGSLKVMGVHTGRPLGSRRFNPGDVVSVQMDFERSTVRFAHEGDWCDPIETRFSDAQRSSVRLGASLYCEMGTGRPVRSLHICDSPS